MSTLLITGSAYNNLINMRLTSKCQDRLQLRFIYVDFKNAF
jgi:hypothetical protein